MIYIRDIERKEIKEKNHTMRDEEASMWSSRRGRRVEAGGRCGLMEVGVCERE